MIYRALYKCRYCDSVFKGGETTNQHIPTMVMAEFCCGKPIATNQGIPVSQLEIHDATDLCCMKSKIAHIGIADFIGFQVEEIDE